MKKYISRSISITLTLVLSTILGSINMLGMKPPFVNRSTKPKHHTSSIKALSDQPFEANDKPKKRGINRLIQKLVAEEHSIRQEEEKIKRVEARKRRILTLFLSKKRDFTKVLPNEVIRHDILAFLEPVERLQVRRTNKKIDELVEKNIVLAHEKELVTPLRTFIMLENSNMFGIDKHLKERVTGKNYPSKTESIDKQPVWIETDITAQPLLDIDKIKQLVKQIETKAEKEKHFLLYLNFKKNSPGYFQFYDVDNCYEFEKTFELIKTIEKCYEVSQKNLLQRKEILFTVIERSLQSKLLKHTKLKKESKEPKMGTVEKIDRDKTIAELEIIMTQKLEPVFKLIFPNKKFSKPTIICVGPQPYIPPPKIKRSMYYVGGKAMSVDWGEKGMCWDSPFRSLNNPIKIDEDTSDMSLKERKRRWLKKIKILKEYDATKKDSNIGMGTNYGYNKKNNLYEEIQRRKKQRKMRQQKRLAKKKKPPIVDRSTKPTLNKES